MNVLQTVETRKAPPHDILASVCLVVLGCIVAGIGDFSFDLKGCAGTLLDSSSGPHWVPDPGACFLSLSARPLANGTLVSCRYIFALSSCLLQASYLLLVERSGVDKGIGTTELLYYNALLSMPFLAVVRAN